MMLDGGDGDLRSGAAIGGMAIWDGDGPCGRFRKGGQNEGIAMRLYRVY